MSDPFDPMSRLEQFDENYTASDAIRPGVDSLPNGEYDFTITEAVLGVTQKSNDPIVKLGLRVIGGPYDGACVERGSLLKTQQNIDRLGADLIALGVPADSWTAANGKRFSQELPRALPSLVGRRFRGKKTTTDGTNGEGKAVTYHNLYVNMLLPSSGHTPPPTGPQRQAAPAARQSVPPPVNDDDVPF